MDIQTLRKMRNSDFGQISQAFDKIANPQTETKSYTDDRFWRLEGDKAGNGTATIRFLPRVEGDELPWVRIFSHGFQGPTGKWYIENSLTTFNQKDPVSEYNSQLWNSTNDDNSPARKQAREQKRRLTYISNIYVVSDPKNPENEGKIFLYRYGKKIFDKISLLMNPEFDGDEAINPFNLWNGANFKLKIRMVEGYRNYDKSEFASTGPLFDDDEKMETVWKKTHSLQAFLDPSNFKSYDELKARLNKVLGVDGFTSRSSSVNEEADTSWSQEAAAPTFKAKSEPKFAEDEDDEDKEEDR